MTSHSTRAFMTAAAIATRFGRPGVPNDQAWIESLFGHVKAEWPRADLVEVLNLDEKAASTRELVDDSLLHATRRNIQHAGDALRGNELPRLHAWCQTCDRCDLAGICRDTPTASHG